MRGRTFKHSFVITDEAQNCTRSQLKMALTRLGYKSKMVIVGDASQSDLPSGESGFLQAQDYLKGISEIAFNHFSANSVVRHPLVKKIVEAYEKISVNLEDTHIIEPSLQDLSNWTHQVLNLITVVDSDIKIKIVDDEVSEYHNMVYRNRPNSTNASFS